MVSSAFKYELLLIESHMLFMSVTNNDGPGTLPLGMPLSILAHFNADPFAITHAEHTL